MSDEFSQSGDYYRSAKPSSEFPLCGNYCNGYVAIRSVDDLDLYGDKEFTKKIINQLYDEYTTKTIDEIALALSTFPIKEAILNAIDYTSSDVLNKVQTILWF